MMVPNEFHAAAKCLPEAMSLVSIGSPWSSKRPLRLQTANEAAQIEWLEKAANPCSLSASAQLVGCQSITAPHASAAHVFLLSVSVIGLRKEATVAGMTGLTSTSFALRRLVTRHRLSRETTRARQTCRLFSLHYSQTYILFLLCLMCKRPILSCSQPTISFIDSTGGVSSKFRSNPLRLPRGRLADPSFVKARFCQCSSHGRAAGLL